jgi:hypothetical protein
MRSFWDRPLGSKVILILGLVYLGLSTVWQRPCALDGGKALCGYKTEWHGIGVWAGLLAVAVVLWELFPILLPRLSMRGWPTAIVSACLGTALAVATIAKMIADNGFLTGYAWAGFGVSLAIMLTAILRVRFRWMTRKHEALEAKLAASSAPPPG